ncbi:MAG: hypothetical protein IJ133_01580 [Clostridia bacterium]|nr:hypothetical protein [Clostridia bacterium]
MKHVSKFVALVAALCMVLSLAACGKKTTENFGVFPDVAQKKGTIYVNLFDVILAKEYDDYWVEQCAKVVGKDSAKETADGLKSVISSKLYGQKAADYYKKNGGMAFDCFYINGAKSFKFKGDKVTTTLTDGSSQTHTYEYLGKYKIGEGETMQYGRQTIDPSFECDVYKSTDDAGEFTYFFLRDDTMETTYHIEFRYGSDLKELQGYFVGNYAYWLAAGIDKDADLTTIHNVIDLFVSENLAPQTEDTAQEAA